MTASAAHHSSKQLVGHVIQLSRHYDDSWIAVDRLLSSLVDSGASLETIASALRARKAPTSRGHDDEAQSPYIRNSMEFHQLPYVVVDATSRDYPARLRLIDDRPLLLYVKGRLPPSDAKPLAIVGSRKASQEGLKAAFDVAAAIAAQGHPIISGLAEGTDAAAHEGALSVSGLTVGVMGTGIDLVYPRENAALAHRIAGIGAVISQFAPGQVPSKTTFPARNAIIAGLAVASLLIELKERSGTRIEAERTLEQGKPVWLWGPIMRRAKWAHQFAEHPGVSFVDSSTDVLEALGRSSDP